MSFDLENIDELLGGQYIRGLDQEFELSASTTQSGCHNYSLTGSSTCGTLNAITLYLEIVAFNPIEYVDEIKGETDGSGQFQRTWHRKDALISFPVILNESLLNKFHLIALHETITFSDLINGTQATIKDIEIKEAEVDEVIRAEITFRVQDSAKIIKACCGSYYEDAPYDECDGSGSPDPNEDPECVSYDVSISLVGSDLQASTTGGPASGTETFTWYLNGIQVGTGATINPTDPGTYKVVATKGNCQDAEEYVYQDCSGFEVTIDYLTLSDGTEILIASANRAATFQWQQDIGAGWVNMAGEVNAYVEPDEDGDYRVVATSLVGNCQDTSNELPVIVPVNCATLYDLEVTRADDILTAEISNYLGSGTPAYQWWKDIGDGNGLLPISGETGSTYTFTERGFFQVEVILDGCTKTAYYIIVDDCILFKAYIQTIAAQAPSYARLTGAAYNPPDTVTYQWYKWIGEAWQLAFTGNPFDLDVAAVVRLITTSGLCAKEDITTFCVDPAAVTPYQKFYGSGDDMTAELYSEFTVTASGLTVGNPATMTQNEINAQYRVHRNGVLLSWASLTDIGSGGTYANDRTRYGFDYADNQIIAPYGWPSRLGEVWEIRKLY